MTESITRVLKFTCDGVGFRRSAELSRSALQRALTPRRRRRALRRTGTTSRKSKPRKPAGADKAKRSSSSPMYAAAAALFAILIAGAVTVTWSRESRNLGFESSPINGAYVSTYEVLNTFPHDPDSFTQGLTFDEHGTLYESDGLYGRSGVRIVEVHTGKSKTRTTNERSVRATSLVVCCLLVLFLSPLTRLSSGRSRSSPHQTCLSNPICSTLAKGSRWWANGCCSSRGRSRC